MRLGLVYLPAPDMSEACARYARTLTSGRSARMTLGEGKLAHVSLVHAEAEVDPAAAWRQVRDVIPTSLPIEIASLGLLRYDVPYNAPPAAPGTVAWLIVPCTEALRAAERAAVSLTWVRAAKITTANGPRFQPHMTIAIWDEIAAPGSFSLPPEIFGREPAPAKLALGVIGANGVYERTLFS